MIRCSTCGDPIDQTITGGHICLNQMYKTDTVYPQVVAHFPGCHKVHLECANKKIREAVPIMKWLDGLNGEVPWLVRNDAENWLESLGGEE